MCFGGWHGFIWWTKKNWAEIPVVYNSDTAAPQVEVKIEGKKYLFLFDTGYFSFFNMKKRALQLHNKSFRRSMKMSDFLGKELAMDVYKLPKISISNFKGSNFEVIEEPDGPEGDGPMTYDFREDKEKRLEDSVGKIGSRLLSIFENGVFLDFPNSVVYFNATFTELRKKGYSLEKLIEAPIGFDPGEGITLWVETDWGKKRFVLDTGCTKSIIRKESLPEDAVSKEWGPDVLAYYSSQFLIEGKDFGEQSFLIFPFSPEFTEIDGVLGMDFFKKHVVHLDFANRVAHFGNAEKTGKKL